MTYEEKKKLIEAAKVIQEHCIKRSKTACGDCPFLDDCGCSLNANYPTYWSVPTITRWTPEDVSLAKALKGFGAESIKRNPNIGIYWIKENPYEAGYLPNNSFTNLGYDEKISIDTIIKETEKLE